MLQLRGYKWSRNYEQCVSKFLHLLIIFIIVFRIIIFIIIHDSSSFNPSLRKVKTEIFWQIYLLSLIIGEVVTHKFIINIL